MLEGFDRRPVPHQPRARRSRCAVADRSFGPVVADRQGRVEIPILVPPGVRAGIARAVDHNGAAARPRSICSRRRSCAWWCWRRRRWTWAASRRSSCSRSSPTARPRNPAGLTLSASAGLLHPLGARSAGRGALPVRSAAPPRQRRRRAHRDRRRNAAQPRRHGGRAARRARPRSWRSRPACTAWWSAAATQRASPCSAHDAFGNPTSATGVEVDRRRAAAPRALIAAGGLGTLTVDAARHLRRQGARHRRRPAGRDPRPAKSCTSPAAHPPADASASATRASSPTATRAPSCACRRSIATGHRPRCPD